MTTLFNTESANKAVAYGIQDFLFRFRKLQLLCNKLELDGILLICGFDSNNNEEYDKLTSWLFTGYSGNVIDKEVYLDPNFKEFVFLITKTGAACYLEPSLFDKIQRYLISIPNISIFCPTLKQMENTDDVEVHKICQFYKMTRNLQSVGVALGAKDDAKIRNIEKWPLLQAYALDDVGCGFFGMNHRATDITQELNKLYEEYDRYSVYNAIQTSVRQMEHHINSTFYIIDSTEMKKRPRIAEEQLNEIIKETFEFNTIKQPSIGEFADLPQPRVLFGKNTNKGFLEKPSAHTFAECSASQERTPLHFTLEDVDPITRFRVGRTYFTTLNEPFHISMRENKDEDDRLVSYQCSKVENPHFADEKLLIGYYALIIRTFHNLLEHFSNSIQDVNQQFVEKKFFDEFCTPEGLNLSLDQLIVQLKCYNAYGVETKTNINEDSSDYVNQNVCILRVQVKNIKSFYNEESLGSILFCDTFYIQSGAYYIFTKNIPYFKAWSIDPTVSESIEKVKDVIICDEFGKPNPTVYENVHLYIPSSEVFQRSGLEQAIDKVELTVHEHGFRVKSQHWGNLALFFKDLDRVELVRKLNQPAVVLYFKDKPHLNSICSDRYYLFLSGLAASEVFLQLPAIFEHRSLPFKYVDDVPEDFVQSNTLYSSGILLNKYFKINKIQGNQILDTTTFISFLRYQEALKINNHKDLNFKLFYKLTEAVETPDQTKKVDVFFVNGPYSSGKTVFAENLAASEKSLGLKTYLYKKDMRDLPQLNNKTFVEGLLKFITDSGVNPGEKVIAVLPSILNTKLIVDNILRMPEFTDKCDVKAIVTKLNVNTFYHNAHKEISENFLTFCNAGYSQFIILDNYGTDESQVDELNAALRGILAYSTIFTINSNIVQQSIAKDILTSNNFNTKMNKIERRRNIPFKGNEKKYVFIPFKVPLLKEKVHSYLYRHILQDNNGFVFDENQLSNPENHQPTGKREKIEDELSILRDRIKRVNMELSKEIPYIYSVNGMVRYEESLEDVYKLSVNSNYVLEKPLPGVKGNITRQDLKGTERIIISYPNFDTKELGLLFYGENLDEGKLRDVLKQLIKPLKEKVKLKTREDLTEDQIKELEIEYRGWGLEDGVFFDGSRFRDMDGTLLKHHPKLDELIEDHLVKENEKLGTINRQIDKEWKTIEQMWD